MSSTEPSAPPEARISDAGSSEAPNRQGEEPLEPLVARVVIEDVHGTAQTKIVFGSEGATSLSSVFTLCNSCIGAGVLSLPYAFMKAGQCTV